MERQRETFGAKLELPTLCRLGLLRLAAPRQRQALDGQHVAKRDG
jgi:hypothetical protein